MIEELTISNLGVIQASTLKFHPGLTVLTGETGAGKTMVLTALGLLLGNRSDSTTIRNGADQTTVEGIWKLPESNVALEIANAAGAILDSGELIVSRSVTSDGRSRAVIGGRSAPIGLLGELAEHLVVVHGQSDQIRLKAASAQRIALDNFAGAELLALSHDYSAVFSQWRQKLSELEDLQTNQVGREQELTQLAESIALLEKLAPQPNEDKYLAELFSRLANTEDLRAAVSNAHDALSSESFEVQDALGLVGQAKRALEAVSNKDPELAIQVESLREVVVNLNDIAAELSGYLANLEAESGMSIDQVQERRHELSVAMKRFGGTLESLFEFQAEAQSRLLQLDTSSERLESMALEVQLLEQQVRELAAKITEVRMTAAKDLEQQITTELADLAMAGARVLVNVESSGSLDSTGGDNISFLLESYPGAAPRAIGKSASGGELSRIMLAVEVVLASAQDTPTFIFDEVDAGVGGATAIELGKRLALLSKKAQVIVVTHLAQVAAFADQHLKVTKTSDAEFTASDVQILDEATKTEELARMLSGLSESISARDNAMELIELATQVKSQ